jgi:hypothetical protein
MLRCQTQLCQGRARQLQLLLRSLPRRAARSTPARPAPPAQAVVEKDKAEAITAVLYPNDSTPEGKELRLKQQYFFVSASLQDVIARFKASHSDWALFPSKACFQLNDTHPTIAVAELMRILVDVEGLDWEKAWGITTQVGSGAHVHGAPQRAAGPSRHWPASRRRPSPPAPSLRSRPPVRTRSASTIPTTR